MSKDKTQEMPCVMPENWNRYSPEQRLQELRFLARFLDTYNARSVHTQKEEDQIIAIRNYFNRLTFADPNNAKGHLFGFNAISWSQSSVDARMNHCAAISLNYFGLLQTVKRCEASGQPLLISTEIIEDRKNKALQFVECISLKPIISRTAHGPQ